VALETIEVHLPKGAVTLEPTDNLLESEWPELVQTLASDTVLLHETRETQHSKVLGYGGTALFEVACERVHRGGSCTKSIEDGSTRRIGNRVENVSVRSCSRHGFLLFN
jgi:hypothetical protein